MVAPRQARAVPAGEAIYRAGAPGSAWRVAAGVVRLDSPDASGEAGFASLAVTGDIIGCETLLFGTYAFSAQALTHCQLSPWPGGCTAASGASLLHSFAQAQRRAADLVALRSGQAADRVLGLIRLLAGNTPAATAAEVVLPTRQDIADITALRFETVSRIIKGLERARVLQRIRVDGVHASRSFRVDFAGPGA